MWIEYVLFMYVLWLHTVCMYAGTRSSEALDEADEQIYVANQAWYKELREAAEGVNQ